MNSNRYEIANIVAKLSVLACELEEGAVERCLSFIAQNAETDDERVVGTSLSGLFAAHGDFLRSIMKPDKLKMSAGVPGVKIAVGDEYLMEMQEEEDFHFTHDYSKAGVFTVRSSEALMKELRGRGMNPFALNVSMPAGRIAETQYWGVRSGAVVLRNHEIGDNGTRMICLSGDERDVLSFLSKDAATDVAEAVSLMIGRECEIFLIESLED